MTSAAEELTPIPYRRILIGFGVVILLLIAFIIVQVRLAEARGQSEALKIRSLISVGMNESDAMEALQRAGYNPNKSVRPYETADYSQVLVHVGSAGAIVKMLNSWQYAVTGGSGWFDVKTWVVIEINDDGVITEIE